MRLGPGESSAPGPRRTGSGHAVFYYEPLVPGVGDTKLSAAGSFLAAWLVSEALALVPGPEHPALVATAARDDVTVYSEALPGRVR